MPKIQDESNSEGLALAINLIDLERLSPQLRVELFGLGLFHLHPRPIWMDREVMEETGLAFACPLLQAAATCDLIRDYDRKEGRTPTRVYIRKVKAWTKLAGDVILVKYGRLNPAVFPSERAVVTHSTLPTTARKI